MRKVVTLLLLSFCLCFLLISCSEKKEAEPVIAAAEEPVAVEPVRTTMPSVVIYDGTPFYNEGNDGKMHYAQIDAKLGDVLSIILLDGEVSHKNAIRVTSDNKEAEFPFVQVVYDAADYWVRDIFITSNPAFVPAVIKDDVFTYKTPDLSDPYPAKEKYELGTIVAAGDVIVSDDESFIPVAKYTGTAFGTEVYIKADAITKNTADVIAVQTLTRVQDVYGDKIEEIVYDELIDQIAGMNLSPDVRYYLGF